MKYSRLLKGYAANIIIKEGQVFKFIVDGQYKVSKDYETTYVFFRFYIKNI